MRSNFHLLTDPRFPFIKVGVHRRPRGIEMRPEEDGVSRRAVGSSTRRGAASSGRYGTARGASRRVAARPTPPGGAGRRADTGGSGDNYMNRVFDDEASTLITSGTAPFTGSYKPEESLSYLDGKALDGLWKLSIYDDAGGDTGYLAASGWSLTVTYTALNQPPGTVG